MSSKCLCCQVPCSSEALNKLTTFLKVWDDVEIEKVFDKYKEPTDSDPKSLSPEKLQAALQELGIHPAGSTERADLDEFKRMARSPSEAEQWAQNMPLAGLLAHSLSGRANSAGLKDLALLTEEEIESRVGVFRDCLVRLVKDKIQLLKEATNAPYDQDRPTGFNLNFRIFCLQKF